MEAQGLLTGPFSGLRLFFHGRFSPSFLCILAVRSFEVFNALFKLGVFHYLPVSAFVPGTTSIGFALISDAGRIVEILVD